MSDNIKVYSVTLNEGDSAILRTPGEVIDHLREILGGGQIGDVFTIDVLLMDAAKFAALPEWEEP